MSRTHTHGRTLLATVLTGAMLLAQGALLADPAEAAATLTVSTTADVPTSQGACGNTGITTPASPLSLREATCLANNIGGSVTINVPAGHYTLANGELKPGTASGQTITIVGAGSASTIIDGGNNSRVFNIDGASIGGVNASIAGVTITKGYDSTFGGAGILDGSYDSPTSDSLTISNSVITGNTAVGTAQPGGGVQMYGGQLTITNSTISNNTSNVDGSGVYFQAVGVANPEGLTVTNSTFSGDNVANTLTSGATGGALALVGLPGTNYTVTANHFLNNTTSSNGSAQGVGAAIYNESGNLSATGNTFTGNSVSGSGSAGSAIDSTGNATLHYNRITGNTGSGTVTAAGGSMNATENWWGCNNGPNSVGCDTTTGSVTTGPYLKLTATASPAHVLGPYGTATITASLTTDSLGAAVGGSTLTAAFDTLPVSFADPPGDATVTIAGGTHTASMSSGQAAIDYHSNTTVGSDNDSVTLDNATVAAVLEVDEPPAITSPNSAHFNIGSAGSFTVTTTGYPNPALTESGTLPTGLTFTDNGNGTAAVSGTPTGGGGSFPITVTANNGYSPNTTQTLTVTVGQPPAFTSPTTATLRVGAAGSFTVTTSGVPTVSSITESGALPAGVTFTDNGNGTATFAGTPTGTGNTYPVTLMATNGVSPNATQALTIQVNQSPAVTTNPTDQTVQPGSPVTFTSAASGVPTPTVQWQRSTDGGASFSNVAGATSTSYTFTTAAGDDGNQYRAVFTNAAGTATTTAATLSVGTAPSFTSADTTRFLAGQPGTFTISTTGIPQATLSRTGAQFPAWLTLTDNGDGTGVLTGTPPAGSGGSYSFTLKAANGFSPTASQTFTLFVDDSPVITSVDHATFTVGQANTLGVTSTAGFPTTTSLTEAGALPSGVSFHDNGDGTATLSGDPAGGTGGRYPITMHAAATGGGAAEATQSFTLTVNEPPRITSADHATFTVGSAGTLMVTTAAGNPVSTTLTKSGTLPAGLSFTDNGDGTATIAGTPNVGSGGVYTLTLTATNGIHPDASQSFTLTVNEPVRITSADHATFTLGTAGAFTVTTTGGQPTTATLAKTGTLPAGVTFVDNGDGTATLGGTPTEDGTFPFTITASNGVLPDSTERFTLTVNSPPTITSPDHTTFQTGSKASFTVTTRPGVPAASTLTVRGTLPDGVTFTDNGDGTATLAGTPTNGTGGSYPLTLVAGNGVGADAQQAFTLDVNEAPLITSADHASFAIGTTGSFEITTSRAWPDNTDIQLAGPLPGGLTLTDNGDGTATLAGTPAAGSNGDDTVTLTAMNTAGHDDQKLTISVAKATQTITVTSTTPATATPGSSYTPAATSDSGLPVTVSIDVSSAIGACSQTGGTVSFTGSGRCVVDFDQPGDSTYATAPQVQQTIQVGKVATSVSVSSSASPIVYGQAPHAIAQVNAAGGAPAGTVQFAVDGTPLGGPVPVTAGSATSANLTGLAAGSHQVTATFAPANDTTYAGSTGTLTQVVNQATTTTTVSPHRDDLIATVSPVAPGQGTPTGTVVFTVDGKEIGSAPLASGTATLQHSVPAGASRTVAATYSGDQNFTGSSASTARRDPKITATVTSPGGRHHGWYRAAVTVTFTCKQDGAPLVNSCPKRIRLTRDGTARSVTRTIYATDGGAATVVVTGINIDQAGPKVHITGIRDGGSYSAAPVARCKASDARSGVARCTLTRTRTRTRTGSTVRVTAAATDKAGNATTVHEHYRLLGMYLAAPRRHGLFQVAAGQTYTLVAHSAHRPAYWTAAPAPRRPDRSSIRFHPAGHHRWALGVTFGKVMRSHKVWDLGASYDGRLHVIRVRIH